LTHIKPKTAGDVALLVTNGNHGAAARSLRSLMQQGMVEQVLLSNPGSRWKMYGYRLAGNRATGAAA
jgi:predicted transcriptional regulator